MPGIKYSPAFSLYRIFWTSIDWLFPPDCVKCKTKGAMLCEKCSKAISAVGSVGTRCGICGDLLFDEICGRCKRLGPAYDKVVSAGYYSDGLDEIIRAIKYSRNIGLGLSSVPLFEAALQGIEADLIIPVPLGKARLRERGHNQAAMLAFPLALALKVPYSSKALRRIRETRSQVNLNVNERMNNVKNAFLARSNMIKGKKVLLVDDVITTGATINDCARALKEGGAQTVTVCTLARVKGSEV